MKPNNSSSTSLSTTAADFFAELRALVANHTPHSADYALLYNILSRICSFHSQALHADYSGLFSRLYAVCRAASIDHHAPDTVRRRARLFMTGHSETPFSEATFKADVAVVAAFVAALSGCSLPQDFLEATAPNLEATAPNLEATAPFLDAFPSNLEATQRRRTHRYEKVRAVVTAVDASRHSFCATSAIGDLTVSIPHLLRTLRVLTQGQAVNLLDLDCGDDGTATARLVILDPDYLIDVSALTAAIKPYGTQAANYLLDLLTPSEATLSIMLGNAANDFMDDLVNTPPAVLAATPVEQLYDTALKRHFKAHILAYTCMAEPLTASYFARLRETFLHIADSVQHRFPSESVGLTPDNVLLEPAFICEALGLRGRFDVMSISYRTILELKSGRAEEFGRTKPMPRQPHVLQMSLYKEMLHYNCGLPRDAVRTFLFYSRYPAFFDQRPSAQAVADVLELRNEIVFMEQRLREGYAAECLDHLLPDALNTAQLRGRFWDQYLRPAIEAVAKPLREASDLEKTYFAHFLTFIEREKYLSKTTDNRPDSNRGLASVWTTDLGSKLASGDILIDLRLTSADGDDGIETLTFALPNLSAYCREQDRADSVPLAEDDAADAPFIPNFTVGEMVQLYERRSEADNATSRQLVRGYIEAINPREVKLRLAYRQRNAHLFSFATRYAIEHDGSDVTATQALRGLFALLVAEPRRRALLLGQRTPEIRNDFSIKPQASPTEQQGIAPILESIQRKRQSTCTLRGNYAPATAAIVAEAERAADYYLLVGPPGTGKTSVALRALVEEFLLRRADTGIDTGLLLMAYTNRAVDEICGMLTDIRAPYVRIGKAQTCAEAYRPRLAETLLRECRNRREVAEALRRLPIVVGTVTTLSAHTALFRLRSYEAIIDEASQVLEPQILGLLCAKSPSGKSAIQRFIMIGDHKQLPAVVLLPESETHVTDEALRSIGLTDLRNSLFQRLHQLAITAKRAGIVGLLDHQGRMHTDICDFVNAEFYDRRLHPVPLPHQCGSLNLQGATTMWERFVSTTRLGFVDVAPRTLPANNKANPEEAEHVARLVETLLCLYARNGESLCPATQIGIIVPFRNQIGTVRTALHRHGIAAFADITIDTVECFQGSQRDFVIFTTTISRPYQLGILSSEQDVGGTRVDRKLNVALTRARRQFFMVGNGRLLSRSNVYCRLIAACRQWRATDS